MEESPSHPGRACGKGVNGVVLLGKHGWPEHFTAWPLIVQPMLHLHTWSPVLSATLKVNITLISELKKLRPKEA